ncbi:MAG: hypothetical protein EBT15_08270 [Betaproteobacteria bacterium]|nr:hypothetical protein [Betaproteobacteria bacterium]
MNLIKSLFFGVQGEQQVFPTSKSYEDLYGDKVREQVAFLRGINRYLPEMKKPHWSSRRIEK